MTTEGGALGGRMEVRRSREGARDAVVRGHAGKVRRACARGHAGKVTRGHGVGARVGGHEGRRLVGDQPCRMKLGQHVVLSLPTDKDDGAGHPYPGRLGQHAVLTLPRGNACGVERVARGGRMLGIPLTYASPYPGLFIGLSHGRRPFGGSLEGRGGGGGYHAEGVPDEHARRFQSQSGDLGP